MNEREQARHWREKLMRLTREELAALTGYSASAIYLLEDRPSRAAVWRRYKNVCLAVQLLRQNDTKIENWRWGRP